MKHLGVAAMGLIGAAAGVGAAVSRPAAPDASALRAEVGALNEPGTQCATNGRLSALFMPDTPDDVVARVTRAMIDQLEKSRAGLTSRDYTGTRWPGTLGDPVNITYSFPPDGINIPGGVGEPSAPNIIHADLTAAFGSATLWKDKIRESFDQWELVTGTVYTEVSDDGAGWGSSGPLNGGSGRGDIRIGSHFIDGSGGVIAYNSFPNNGDMVIDSGQTWSSTGNWRSFRNTIVHENGHGMGIFHVCSNDSSQLMEPFLNTAIDGPQLDDRRAKHYLYGDPTEDNDSTGGAEDFGTLFTQSIVFDELSIRHVTDLDYFTFDLSVAGEIDVKVTPVGTAYNTATQSGDGSCPSSQTALNSAAQHDLVVEVLDGATLPFASANNTSAGGIEQILNLDLTPGQWYIRVSSNNLPSSTARAQLYEFRLTTMSQGITGDINGDCVVDTADVGGLIGSFGTSGPPGGAVFADVNEDGVVDTADLGAVLASFGQTCP